MINKKIIVIAKTKRTDFGIFGKFAADLFNMSESNFAVAGASGRSGKI
jgi:hypothetical protein